MLRPPLGRYGKFYHYVWIFLFDKVVNSSFHPQSWLKKAEQINSPVPLPEGPRTALLTEMLAVVPYKAPEKKGEKREAREGLHPRGPLDTKSGETQAPSTHDEEKGEDGEESDSSRTRKRVASDDAEEDQPPPAPRAMQGQSGPV
jgi:hypothetical protein